MIRIPVRALTQSFLKQDEYRDARFLADRIRTWRKTKKRPGRDLNPGQKIRNLLGCPLPYRDFGIGVMPY